MIVLAFDPGVRTGWAIVDLTPQMGSMLGRLLALGTVPHVHAVVLMERIADGHAVEAVVVEDGSDLPVYARYGAVQGRRRDALARSVGQTDARARTLVEAAEMRGWPVVTVAPAGSKWEEAHLRGATGYTGGSSQHSRDAVRAALSAEARARLAELTL